MDSLEDEALLRVEEERLGLGDAKGLGGGKIDGDGTQ